MQIDIFINESGAIMVMEMIINIIIKYSNIYFYSEDNVSNRILNFKFLNNFKFCILVFSIYHFKRLKLETNALERLEIP